MPLGLLRLNERTQRPNANINFIKPLADRPDTHIAQDFLERIAAQCYPIMKEHYLSVMSLEEYEPNPEFLGRNFNAGEVIQLVLKDKAGRWLSFRFVQMVMMHELSHCKHMNHSRAFWSVRNGYAKQMEELWAKRYVGEGMWGRGKNLASGEFVHEQMPENAQIPEHLCGGTYRRRGRKRKRGRTGGEEEPAKLTYAERQQKRIAKKFGKHGEGNALGDDELVRGALDQASGKTHSGKPRVAKSKRGRELRANAALARFEAAKTQTAPETTPELEDGGSETESDFDWSGDETDGASGSMPHGNNAGRVKDQQGRDLFKVCGDENEDDAGGQDEMDELRVLSGKPKDFPAAEPEAGPRRDPWPEGNDSETESESGLDDHSSIKASIAGPGRAATKKEQSDELIRQVDSTNTPEVPASPTNDGSEQPEVTIVENSAVSLPNVNPPESTIACTICSLENDRSSSTCMACSHVLKPSLVKNHWRCTSETCKGSKYVNAGDVGRCGLCGAFKPAANKDVRPVGVTSAATLRWD